MPSAEIPVRHKRGDTREDGMRFWCYAKHLASGEYWVTPEKFREKIEAETMRAERYKERGARAEVLRRYNASPKAKETRARHYATPTAKAYREGYAEANREFKRSYMRDYARTRAQEDPMFRLNRRVRVHSSRAAKYAGMNKLSRSFELLGTDLETFKAHMESLFTGGMCWEKMGREIHIDHIVPLASGKTPEEIWALCHYTNLQPLWAFDNLSKGAKLPDQLPN